MDRQLPARLLSRGLQRFPEIEQSISNFRIAATEKFADARHGDQYGTLLAGWWALQNSNVATLEQARGVLAEFNWTDQIDEHGESDGEHCLRRISQAQVHIPGCGAYTVQSLLDVVAGLLVEGIDLDARIARRVLNEHGIGITGDRLVLFANKHQGLVRLLQDSKFVVDPRAFLRQVKGAVSVEPRRFGTGPKLRSVGIPFAALDLERGGFLEEQPI
jgi:putative DNA primase/helicase